MPIVLYIKWKYHKETHCFLKQKKCQFFLKRLGKQEDKTGPPWETGSSGKGEGWGKGV
jgi:hypothetical protein